MTVDSAFESVRKRYLFFGEREARGRCHIYEKLALDFAADPDLISLIATFPKDKRQPNLIFASLRKCLGHVPKFAEAREVVTTQTDALTKIIFSHDTQTNEPGRCATLLPLLSQLPQPLALLEIGASAGLCLIPDRYNYDYGRVRLTGAPEAPDFALHCTAGSNVPLPETLPQVTWRAGLDTNPLNINDADQRAWLETLIWPSDTHRLRRLQTSMEIAANEQIQIETGDLHTSDLDRIVDLAPQDATLVIYHSAVLPYTLSQAKRDEFASRVVKLTDFWVSNESPLLFSNFGKELAEDRPDSHFLTALNGEPIAWADPHGASVTWIVPEALV